MYSAPDFERKLCTASELGARIAALPRPIVFTNGCFDLLHVGHLQLLREAKKFGDVLVVGLNSDSSVRGLKGDGRPIVPEPARAEATRASAAARAACAAASRASG